MQTLTHDQIITLAPAAATTNPISKASSKYSFVSTMDAIQLIESAGWVPYKADQSSVREKTNDGFQRHLIKFTRSDMLLPNAEERIDLILFNSHDCGSAFRLAMGIFRFVCANGMVVGNTNLEFSHRHINFDQDAFLSSVNAIAHNGSQIADKVDTFKHIELSPQENGIYAQAAAELISDTPEKVVTTDLLRARRWADRQDSSLWTTFNKVQENVMKGGVRRVNQKRTRKVKALDKDLKLNKALWTLTEKMAEIKMAA